MNKFEASVLKRLGQGKPLNLAAVSGGADSTAMLAALAALRDEAGLEASGAEGSRTFNLRCLHVEHGIRPAAESRGDARYVKELCKKLKVPCKIVFIPPGRIARAASGLKLGIEGAARLYRHRIWNNELCRLKAKLNRLPQPGRPDAQVRILVAHTKDDLLETILMRFLRGAGPMGLASLKAERGKILRPLLDLSRRDVLAYLEERHISYRIDATNEDTHYLRNRVRHKLIPLLDSSFPFWRNALEFSGETQGLVSEFLLSEARKRLIWEESGGDLQIALGTFLGEPDIVQEESFFQAVDRLAAKKMNLNPGKTLKRSSLRLFLRELKEGSRAADLGFVRAERKAEYLALKPALKIKKGFALLIKERGSYTLKAKFSLKAGEFSKTFSGEGQNPYFLARLPLILRADEGVIAAGQKCPFLDMLKSDKGSGFLQNPLSADLIIAEDRDGIAALIGTDKGKPVLVYRREDYRSEDFDKNRAPVFFMFSFEVFSRSLDV